MFRGVFKTVTPGLTRQERRLLTLADVTKTGRSLSQRHTHRQATRELARFDAAKKRHPADQYSSKKTRSQGEHLASMMPSGTAPLPRSPSQFHKKNRAKSSTRCCEQPDDDEEEPSDFPRRVSGPNRFSTARQMYDDVDPENGQSLVQLKFDKLVHAALLRFGPPLPAEFVSANDVITASSSMPTPGRRQRDMFTIGANGRDQCFSYSTDLGADSSNFVMYDEVGLKTHELMRIIRLYQPSFTTQDHCDDVPFSLLIKNCSYLRAFGGKVHYMRYLRRERRPESVCSDGASMLRNCLVVSIAKYKMREVPPQDGVRQGPQPWLYSYQLN